VHRSRASGRALYLWLLSIELAECHLSCASIFEEAARFFEKFCTYTSARLRSYFTRFLESHFRQYSIFRSTACSGAAQDMMVWLSPSLLSKYGPTEWPRCWQIFGRAEENLETLNMVGIQTF